MKKLLIFDLDGTLLDTLSDLRSSVNYALRKFGFPTRTMEQIRNSVGNGLKFLVSSSLPSRCAEEKIEAVLAKVRKYYGEHYHDDTRPYEGILPLLQKLKEENYILAIVSNKPDPMVKGLCALFFGDTVSYAAGEIVGIARKPAPDAVDQAIDYFAVDKSDAVYIGDSEVDLLTSRNAGVPCLSVTWGFRSKEELSLAGAEILCETPQELYEQIKRYTK